MEGPTQPTIALAYTRARTQWEHLDRVKNILNTVNGCLPADVARHWNEHDRDKTAKKIANAREDKQYRAWTACDGAVKVYPETDELHEPDERPMYDMLIRDVQAEDSVDAVFVREIGDLAENATDLRNVIQHIVKELGVKMMFADCGWRFEPDEIDSSIRQVIRLDALEQLSRAEHRGDHDRVYREIRRFEATKEKHNGRPPLGYSTDEAGNLVPASDFEEVSETLEAVKNGSMSKREAAKRLDCARRTVGRAIEERPELYHFSAQRP